MTKKRTELWVGLVVIIAIAFSVIWFIVPIGRLGKVCGANDEDVRKTTEALQRFYQTQGAFPKVSDVGQSDKSEIVSEVFLEGIRKLYHADLFSLDNPDEMFVYYKSNCKLKVTPSTQDVYPR